MIPLVVAGLGAAASAAASLYGNYKQGQQADAARKQNMALLNNYNAQLNPRIAGMESQYQSALQAAGQDYRIDQNPFFKTVGRYDPGVFSGVANLESDPGYQARMDAAGKALNTRDAVAGTLRSGQGAQEFARNMQEAASQEYQQAYQRALNTYQTQLGAQGQMFGQANQMYQNQAAQQQMALQQQLQLAGLNANMLGQQYGLQGQALSAAMGQNSATAQANMQATGGMMQSLSGLGGDIFKGAMGYQNQQAQNANALKVAEIMKG